MLKAMRAAFRQFVEKGGPDGRHFAHRGHPYEADPFSLALGELRARIGEQVAVIAGNYDLEIDDELARILPPRVGTDDDEASWSVGFDRE